MRLYEVTERLDPNYEVEWSELTALERDYFYFSIKTVLLERADVRCVIEIDIADDDMIARRRNLREQTDIDPNLGAGRVDDTDADIGNMVAVGDRGFNVEASADDEEIVIRFSKDDVSC